MKMLKSTFLLLLLIGLAASLPADEGMWMPHQMKDLDLQARGLQMNPEALIKSDGSGIMNAIVSFGGGTGEFVSGQGLILTNHHVAFGALQRASDEQHDYIEDGFLAQNLGEEIPAPGYIAYVLLGYEEITSRVNAALSEDMSPLERYNATDRITKEIIEETEKESPDMRAEIADMYSGNQYYLFRFKTLKDLRIVYAPPRDLGNFGGDIDNWMWPRHTADFTFLRAYVSRKNIGSEFDEDNVPYRPKSFLKISMDGVNPGDFTFVMGYPGRTYRNFTVAELESDFKLLRSRLSLYSDLIAFFEAAGERGRAVQIKYASLVKGLHNAVKNYQGKLEGIDNYQVVEKKSAAQERFKSWVRQSEQRQKKYGAALSDIRKFMDRYTRFQSDEQVYQLLTNRYYGPALLSQAYLIYRTVQERQKPPMEREEEFLERNIPNLRQQIQLADRRYDLETDKTYFKYLLQRLSGMEAERVPATVQNIIAGKSGAEIDRYVDRLYAQSMLADAEKRLKMIDMTPEELRQTNDPFLQLAADLDKELSERREKQKALDQSLKDLKKTYIAGLLEFKNGELAPDANGTIRFTYGPVKGYSPRDAVEYLPQTTLSGVIEKDTGEKPFRVPEKLKALEAVKDFGQYEDEELGDVPACFLNTTNVTGGNSGSPALNAKGEQIGIIFDMTYESVIGDYYVIPELQRTISVDIRYVLFVTEKFSGAEYIIHELGLD